MYELLKGAACHELRELLNVLKSMELKGNVPYQAIETIRRRVWKVCDLLDAIERNEGAPR